MEGTGKKHNSHEAEKNKEVAAKSREEIRANREGTGKAGKGPLKHHEEKDQVRRREKHRGQAQVEETRKSSEETVKKLGKTGKERGSRRPPRPPSRREQERNQQDRGRAREER